MSKYVPMRSQWLAFIAAVVLCLSLLCGGNANALDPSEEHYPLKLLGKFVFFDKISVPARQSCSSCHEPSTGGTNNNALVNMTVVAVPGANFHVSSGLKPPTSLRPPMPMPALSRNSGSVTEAASFLEDLLPSGNNIAAAISGTAVPRAGTTRCSIPRNTSDPKYSRGQPWGMPMISFWLTVLTLAPPRTKP